MPRTTPTVFEKADERGLLDQLHAGGLTNDNGNAVAERKPLHQRKLALSRLCKEEVTRDRETGQQGGNGGSWGYCCRGHDEGGGDGKDSRFISLRLRLPSRARGKKSGFKLNLKKRKQVEDEVDEEAPASPLALLAPSSSSLSSSTTIPPPMKQRLSTNPDDNIHIVHIADAALPDPATASLGVPKDICLRLPRSTTRAGLILLLEVNLRNGARPEGRSLSSRTKEKAWEWEVSVQWAGEMMRLGEGIKLGSFVQEGSERTLEVEGRVGEV